MLHDAFVFFYIDPPKVFSVLLSEYTHTYIYILSIRILEFTPKPVNGPHTENTRRMCSIVC